MVRKCPNRQKKVYLQLLKKAEKAGKTETNSCEVIPRTIPEKSLFFTKHQEESIGFRFCTMKTPPKYAGTAFLQSLCPKRAVSVENYWFLIQKRGFFSSLLGNQGVRGGVHQ